MVQRVFQEFEGFFVHLTIPFKENRFDNKLELISLSTPIKRM